MSDKTIIVEIQYDTDQAIKNVTKLSDAVEMQKMQQKALKENLDKGLITWDEYNKELAKSQITQKKANEERQSTIKLLGSEKGSINEVKARIKQLEQENGKLNRTTKEGNAQFQANNKQIQNLNETLKAAKKDTGEAVGAFGKLSSSINNLPGPIGGTIKGIVAMTKAGLAFIATPLGAIIAGIAVALKTLISYFKGSEEGQNRLNKIMAIGGAVIGNMKDLFQNFGKVVFDTIMVLGARFTKFFASIGLGWEKLKGIFSENTAAIEEQKNKIAEAEKILTARQDERRKSAEQLKNGLKGIVEETKKEIAISKNLADRQAALDKLQRDFLVEKQRLEAEVAEIRTKAVNKDKYSAEERIKLLKEANEKELAILDTDMKIAKEKAELKKIQNSLSNSTKEDLDEQAQLEANVFAVQRENATKRMALASQLSSAMKEMNAEQNKGAEESEKINEKKAEEEKKIIDETLQRRAEAMAQLAEIEYNRVVAEQKTLEDIANVKKEKAAEELAAKLENENLTFEQLQELKSELSEEELELELERRGILYEEYLLAESEYKAKLVEIDNEYNAQIEANRQANLQQAYDSMQKIIAATGAMGNKRVTIIADAFSKISTINFKELKSYKDTFVAIAEAASGLTSLITAGHDQELMNLEMQKNYELGLVGDNAEAQDAINRKYANESAKIKKQQAKDDKNAAIIDATIATAIGIVQALANPGGIAGIIIAALVGVLGAVQIASISSQPTPNYQTYAKGGIIGGKSHAQGGTKFYGEDGSMFEAEKGEAMFVMKKDATAEIAALSMINESHGGRSFFGSGGAKLEEGGMPEGQDMQKMVSEEFQRTPIYVKVSDIEMGLTEVSNTKNAGVI